MDQWSKNIKTYFRENDNINDQFEVEDSQGILHIIDKDILLKSILKLDKYSRQQIVKKITMIELRNPNDINNFLTYVAKGLVG